MAGGGYDWSRKIAVQLKDSESLQLICVLRGWLPVLEVANHGIARDKRLTLRRQEAERPGFLLNIRQGAEARVVPIPPFEAHRIVALALQVIQTNNPSLSNEMISDMAKEMALDILPVVNGRVCAAGGRDQHH